MKTSHLYRLRLKNFRSFYKEQEIVFNNSSERAVTVFYGPNSGGKTNIAMALQFIQFFIRNSNKAELKQIPRLPYKLKTHSANEPSEFEVEFTYGDRHFTYGFTITQDAVIHEFLREFSSAKTRKQRTIFERTNNKLNASSYKFNFGDKLLKETRSSSLLITKARESNNEYSNLIFEWLDSFNVLLSLPNETIQWTVQQLRNKPDLKTPVQDLLNRGDLWITSFDIQDVNVPVDVIEKLPFNEITKQQMLLNKSFTIKTGHALRDKNEKVVGVEFLDLAKDESRGTQRYFELAVPVYDTLSEGKILYIDEFGSPLHQDMCNFLITLFKSPQNKMNAQLIVNTHETSLMSKGGPLSREDILFVEKNRFEETVVSSLLSKSARETESFEKRYREGLYGAKPFIDI